MSSINLYCRCLLRKRIIVVTGLSLFAVFLISQKSIQRKVVKSLNTNKTIINALNLSIGVDVFQEKEEIKAPKSPIKILCLINTSKKQLKNRAIHINATWAQRCDKTLFLSYDKNINLPYLDLQIKETRRNLWDKWRAAFKWVFENKIDNFDFFLRADDDSYFIMENLRNFLLPFNPNDAILFGSLFKLFVKTGYMSGGPGMIFTRKAIKQLASGMYKPEICPEITEGDDDIEIGACAEILNITKIDTRDQKGRLTQLPWSPTDHFTTGLNFDQLRYLFYQYKQNKRYECCSDYMISFHYVYKELIYTFEFLIYKAKVF